MSMELELEGKKALVTGASRGIGLTIAKRLSAEGVVVAMNAGHDRDRLEAAVAGVENAVAAFADISDPAAVTGRVVGAVWLCRGCAILLAQQSRAWWQSKNARGFAAIRKSRLRRRRGVWWTRGKRF